MLKRINWKAIFKGFAWLISLVGTVVLMSFIEIKKQAVKCNKVEILIPGADNFIEREEIDAILKESQGDLVGRDLEKINLHQIEKSIAANPYIAFVKVYADMGGVIAIEIKQRQPILRILNAGGQDYYVDRTGLKMPVSPNFTANVLVATGNILEGFNGKVDTLLTPIAKDLYKTALYVKQDTLWDAQIEQVFVNDKNDIELIPRVGNQRIILGSAQDLGTKLDNLLAFYKQAMPKVGWNAYRTINLKYVNQIVCEKRDSLAIKKMDKPIVPDSVVQQRKSVDSVIKSTIQSEIKKAVVKTEEGTQTKKETSSVRRPKENKVLNKKETEVENKSTKPSAGTKEKTEAKKTDKIKLNK
ncbi:cell division protein FtsQ/DivIB [Pedobacter sp. ASV28]|uniref:cell division protein FtsQ/DivIB n=1 Tax=Pedobacter sp. ASV28 TaxID=2795123 RepID=UPI0018EB1114|nr:cell division protein FtsQ [Pedobacter sp. ASV28]